MERTRSRHGLRALASMLAVVGLTAVAGLPAVASSFVSEPPPVPPLDVQSFTVSGDVAGTDATIDVSAAQSAMVPQWILPMKGRLNDGFGPRPNAPVAGVSAFHRGQDITGPCGSSVLAAAAGVVVQAGWFGTYGNWVLIDHGDGVQTGYAHEATIGVAVGQRVRAGQVIGTAGSTGASTGCHLHLEAHIDGTAIDPVPFFRAKGVPLG